MSLEITEFGNPLEIVEDIIDKSNAEIGALTVSQIKNLCPVAIEFGGTLRNSYMFKTDIADGGFNDSAGEKSNKKLEGQPEKHTGYLGSNEHYAPYVNFGTRKMVAQPHVEPAIDIMIKGKTSKQVVKKRSELQMKQAQALKKKKYFYKWD